MGAKTATFELRVRAKPLNNEEVRVVGDCEELGEWSVSRSVALVRSDSDSSLWTCSLTVPCPSTIRYRYLICERCGKNASSGKERLVVKAWESMLEPRQAHCTDADFGKTVIVECGDIGTSEDKTDCLDKGWLTGDLMHVQFAIHDSYEFPLKIFDKDITSFRIKLTCEQPNGLKKSTEAQPDYNKMHLRTLSPFHHEDHNVQDEKGHVYRPDDYLIFHTDTFKPESKIYLLDVYSDEDEPEFIGRGVILGHQFVYATFNTLHVCLMNSHSAVGFMTVRVLFVKPYHGPLSENMEHNYTRYWNHTRPTVDVGHRGMGQSYISEKGALEEENTIASLAKSYDYGASFAEFDVIMTKDFVPILYHNAAIFTCYELKNGVSTSHHNNISLNQTFMMDLTLEQSRHIKVSHAHEDSGSYIMTKDTTEESPWTMLFPKLEDAFDLAPPGLGFLIEIKYPVEDVDNPLEPSLDCNKMVDTILDVVDRKAGKRKVIFTCFHPAVCTLVRLKQPRYPVLFTTSGENDRWPMYCDKICRTIPIAVAFATAERMLGISTFSTPLLKDMENIMAHARRSNLVVFTWGDTNNDKNTQQRQRDAGVHGLIFDRINNFNSLRSEMTS